MSETLDMTPAPRTTTMLSRAEYQRALVDLRIDFPWLGFQALSPAPGHLPLVKQFLREFETICGRDWLLGHMDFLRIIRTPLNARLQIHADLYDATPARREAITELVGETQNAARMRCPTCGDESSHYNVWCERHKETVITCLFTDDPQPTATNEAPPEDEGPVLCPPPDSTPGEPVPDPAPSPETAATDAGDAVPPETPAGPRLQLYSPESLARLEARLKRSSDREVKERLESTLQRLKKLGAHRPLACLPVDWISRLARLRGSFPNFSLVLDFIEDQFALSALGDGTLQLPPMILNGPAGIGKTELVMQLAETFGTDTAVVDLATAQTSAALVGTASHWANSQTGKVFEVVALGEVANPFIVLEELEKFDSHHGDAISFIYGLLEERTAKQFADLSLVDFEIDASRVQWMATTNATATLPAPALSRFEVFDVPAPTPEQVEAITRSIYQRLRERHHWGGHFDEGLADEVVKQLRGYSPRQIRRSLRAAFGRAARGHRNHLVAADLRLPEAACRRQIGFVS